MITIKHKKLKIYCADFETTSKVQYEIEGKTRVYLWCLKSLNLETSIMGISIDEFFKSIDTLPEDELIIYFHNLSFDGEFICWYLLENGYEYQEDIRTLKVEKHFEPTIDEMNSIYMIKVISPLGKYIEFRCSYKLFPKSIEDIGEMVGVKKLKETHNYEEVKNYKGLDEVTQEEKDYINNDVLIMCHLIKYLDSVGINALTMSSSAYKNWKKDKYHLCKYQLIKDDNDEINECVRKSYRGGITKVNPKYAGVDLYDVMSFDVNSLYPSVMYDNPMPIGMGTIFKSIEECKKAGYPIYLVCCVVTYAEVKEGYHAFIGSTSGFSYSRKYEYNNVLENKSLYLWGKEFELFTRIYDTHYSIVKVIGYKQAYNVFKDYIDRWYTVKENAKTPAERQLAKLMLNSLYGKFGMNDHRVSKIPVGFCAKGIVYNFIDNDTVYYDKKIASYITSMARVKYATMMNLCGDSYVYGDTDSLYVIGHEIPPQFKGLVDDKKRGMWGYEGHYTHFKALKAKCYIKQLDNGEIVRRIAGCPKDASVLIDFENFNFGLKLKGVKKLKRKVNGGIIIDNTDFTIKV